jgi:hypothetical protein
VLKTDKYEPAPVRLVEIPSRMAERASWTYRP